MSNSRLPFKTDIMKSTNTLDSFKDQYDTEVVYIPTHLQPRLACNTLDEERAEIPVGADIGRVAYINERFVHVQFFTGDGTPKINTQACKPGDLWFKI